MNDLTKITKPNSTEKTEVRPRFPKKMFTVSEDAIIIQCVSLYGADNWKLISQFLPGRSIRQLRERYNTYLKPGTLDTPWTPEEDLLLSQKIKEYGKHWKIISQFFKGRNQNNIKNRWNFHLKGGAALKITNNITSNDEKNSQNNTSNFFDTNTIDDDQNLNKINNTSTKDINFKFNLNNNNNNNSINDLYMNEMKNINNEKPKVDEYYFNNNNKDLNANKITNKIINNNQNIKLSPNMLETNQNWGISNKIQQNPISYFNNDRNTNKDNQQEITATHVQSNPISEVFNDDEIELYCSNDFTSFQFDNPNNRKQITKNLK